MTFCLFLLLIFLWFFLASTNLSAIPFFMEYSNVFILLWIFSILFDSTGLRLSFNLSFIIRLFSTFFYLNYQSFNLIILRKVFYNRTFEFKIIDIHAYDFLTRGFPKTSFTFNLSSDGIQYFYLI